MMHEDVSGAYLCKINFGSCHFYIVSRVFCVLLCSCSSVWSGSLLAYSK